MTFTTVSYLRISNNCLRRNERKRDLKILNLSSFNQSKKGAEMNNLSKKFAKNCFHFYEMRNRALNDFQLLNFIMQTNCKRESFLMTCFVPFLYNSFFYLKLG